jgi:hypothetical protein
MATILSSAIVWFDNNLVGVRFAALRPPEKKQGRNRPAFLRPRDLGVVSAHLEHFACPLLSTASPPL